MCASAILGGGVVCFEYGGIPWGFLFGFVFERTWMAGRLLQVRGTLGNCLSTAWYRSYIYEVYRYACIRTEHIKTVNKQVYIHKDFKISTYKTFYLWVSYRTSDIYIYMYHTQLQKRFDFENILLSHSQLKTKTTQS